MKKRLCILFLSLLCVLHPTSPPELTPHLTRRKIEEIMKSHVSQKKLNKEILSRTLVNFLDELDPTKTYLLKDEVLRYLSSEDHFLERLILEYKHENFVTFKELYSQMGDAIQRRNEIEKRIDSKTLPKKVSATEFKDLDWAESEDALEERLLRLRALQLDVANEFEEESSDHFMKRIVKRRHNHERILIGESNQVRERQMLSFLIKAVSSSLDNHTVYFTPTEAKQFMTQVQQRLFGVGALLRDDLNGFSIIKLIEGGPALSSGTLKIGDRVIAVNQEPVVGLDISEAVERIRGPKGSKVKLTILRDLDEGKDEKFDIEIIRDEIVIKEARFEINTEPFGKGVIAHIKLFSFYQDPTSSSAKDIKAAIEEIQKEHRVEAVLLDLRNNAGGLLPQAVAVTGLFIKKGIVVSIKDSQGRIQHLRNFNDQPAYSGPLVILANEASASAAEIVTQTLKDYGRALIVGGRTFGKGTYQTFTFDGSHPNQVNPQGEFKVTRGMYFTVSGKSPQQVGLEPDIAIAGVFTFRDVGERFSKYPLENSAINPNFIDDFQDIHPFHRHKVKKIYQENRQEYDDLYGSLLPTIRQNSEERRAQNKNYQNFLKVLQKEDPSEEEIEPFGENDLQLEEAVNVTKDLIQLLQESKTPQKKVA
ncbi:MAG: S41 family peptidase [Simkaniaceae bacterium]